MEEPLAFNVKVKRNGFLTLIVNASSGRTQLVAPNAYSDACHCFCFDGEDVPFPGKLLLNTIHDFKILQDGPRGWEELIAILSDEPLVENRDLEEAFTSYGFLYLDEEKIQRYTSKLTNWTDESWGAGVLGYRVVER